MLRCCSLLIALLSTTLGPLFATELHLNDRNYLETQGLSVLVYEDKFHENEYVVDAASTFILAANAADAFAQ
jgi:hypothetical protein